MSAGDGLVNLDAMATAAAVRSGGIKATEVLDATLARVAGRDPAINSFTTVTEARARAEAERVDRAVADGEDPGPLAGVPVAVKNLFDIRGVVTLSGSAIDAESAPATADAAAVASLTRAGALVVGALNMDEYAYGFTNENSHVGPCRNPHDLARVAGGSSGGSGAAVAAGLVPLTLGTDTNGSVRVPAALCGTFGFKPTFGRISRRGSTLFAPSLDHVGPLARSVRDLALAFDVLHGFDSADPVSLSRPVEHTLAHIDEDIVGLRIAVADDYFTRGCHDIVLEALDKVVSALSVSRRVTIPEAERARAAAMVITAAEGASLHMSDLMTRPQDFDPMTRDRFLAGALVPGAHYVRAQRFRAWYRREVAAVFRTVDIILAPTTPFAATPIGQRTIEVEGREVVVAPNMGLFTQPLSFVGLPVVSVPVSGSEPMPLGVQVIGAPYAERNVLRVAAALEAMGVASAPVVGPGG
ncbi:MAG: AtzE family amidohydrolase [Acidimicrobiales bacterium]